MSKTDTKSTVLLQHHLKALKLPTMLRECEAAAQRCAAENVDHLGFLLQLCERELLDRERRAADRRLKAARFPTHKTLDSFDFKAQPSLNKLLLTELLRGEYLDKRENVLLVGGSGTGKTHLATALGIAACGQGKRVRFFRVTEPNDLGEHKPTPEIRDRWLLASRGYFGGCVPHNMEFACGTTEHRAVVRIAIDSLMNAIQKSDSPLDSDTVWELRVINSTALIANDFSISGTPSLT